MTNAKMMRETIVKIFGMPGLDRIIEGRGGYTFATKIFKIEWKDESSRYTVTHIKLHPSAFYETYIEDNTFDYSTIEKFIRRTYNESMEVLDAYNHILNYPTVTKFTNGITVDTPHFRTDTIEFHEPALWMDPGTLRVYPYAMSSQRPSSDKRPLNSVGVSSYDELKKFINDLISAEYRLTEEIQLTSELGFNQIECCGVKYYNPEIDITIWLKVLPQTKYVLILENRGGLKELYKFDTLEETLNFIVRGGE